MGILQSQGQEGFISDPGSLAGCLQLVVIRGNRPCLSQRGSNFLINVLCYFPVFLKPVFQSARPQKQVLPVVTIYLHIEKIFMKQLSEDRQLLYFSQKH